MYSCGPPHMAVQKQDDQHEHTFSNYVRIQDVVQKTCLRRWTIGKSGERGSRISVLTARYDDDEDETKKHTAIFNSHICSSSRDQFRYTEVYKHTVIDIHTFDNTHNSIPIEPVYTTQIQNRHLQLLNVPLYIGILRPLQIKLIL